MWNFTAPLKWNQRKRKLFTAFIKLFISCLPCARFSIKCYHQHPSSQLQTREVLDDNKQYKFFQTVHNFLWWAFGTNSKVCLQFYKQLNFNQALLQCLHNVESVPLEHGLNLGINIGRRILVSESKILVISAHYIGSVHICSMSTEHKYGIFETLH